MSNGMTVDPSNRPPEPLMDALLRDTLPEIKLALGREIDRENARALPERYAQLLPETVLVTRLRPDAAEALMPVARQVEAELTDSCMRHGSIYDRAYSVQLRKADREDAPLFEISAHPRAELDAVPSEPLTAEPRRETTPVTRGDTTAFAPARRGGFDPDATRVEGMAPPAGWEPGRWELLVSGAEGTEQERFSIPEPVTTVGRRSDDPELASDLALTDAPHVSRRQIALVWSPQGEEPGFLLYNLGLNSVHVRGGEVQGANLKRGALRLEEISRAHAEWIGPGEPVRIGESGPVLHVEEAADGESEGDAEMDPDATRIG